jgi:hypothetical protein
VLHTDGALVAARPIGSPNDAANVGPGSIRIRRYEIADLLLWSLDVFYRMTRTYTRATGLLTLRAGLWTAAPLHSSHSAHLAHPDYKFPGWASPTPALGEDEIGGPFEGTEIVSRVDRLTDGQARVADAAALANGVAQSLGVAELDDLLPDGTFKRGSLLIQRWQPRS